MRAGNGDSKAFTEIYREHVDVVYALVLRIVGDVAAAADITQDAFVTAWRRIDELRAPEALRGWLLRIARHAALNYRKRAAPVVPVDAVTLTDEPARRRGFGGDRADASAPDAISDPALAHEQAELAALVWIAAGALDGDEMALLELNLRHGLEPAEIAPILDSNRNATKQALWRMRGKLGRAVGAAVLWRGGRVRCRRLGAALQIEAVADEFTSKTLQLIDRHVRTCAAPPSPDPDHTPPPADGGATDGGAPDDPGPSTSPTGPVTGEPAAESGSVTSTPAPSVSSAQRAIPAPTVERASISRRAGARN